MLSRNERLALLANGVVIFLEEFDVAGHDSLTRCFQLSHFLFQIFHTGEGKGSGITCAQKTGVGLAVLEGVVRL